MSDKTQPDVYPEGMEGEAEELNDDGEYLEVIDLDEVLGDEPPEGPDDTWISDEELETDEPEEEAEKSVFNGVEGIPLTSPVNVFKEHSGSVFCLALDTLTGSTVISGGEDDKAYVWNAESGEVRFTSEGHKDSVVQVGFSHDFVYAFSADMGGLIKVWRVSTGEEVWSTETSDLKWARWHTKTHILFAGTEDGTVYMWLVPHGQCKVQQVSGAITAAELFSNGKYVCLAHGEGSLSILDLKEWKIAHTVPGRRGNQSEILCISINADGNLIACGHSDGTARLLQSQTGRILWEINEPLFMQAKEDEQAIESVAFSITSSWLFVAGLNGTVCIYDIGSQSRRHVCNHVELRGASKLIQMPGGDNFLVAHLNGALSMWDARAGSIQKVFYGHQDEILDAVISKDGLRLFVASNDGTVCWFTLG